MRKYFLILCICFTVSNLFAQHKQDLNKMKISDDLFYRKIQKGVYVITHYFPSGGNSMCVFLPDSQAVLIDTPYETSGTKSLLDWIYNNFGKVKIKTIVTGFHQDNLGGNDYLISQGIPVYGSDLTKKLIIEQGEDFKNFLVRTVENKENKKYYNSYKSLRLVPPTHTFPIKNGIHLEIGDEIFEVFFPGESHTIDNTVVYLHNRKILFGGCMIKGLRFKQPGFMGYANMKEWPISVNNVINRYPECKIVVPGHGEIGGFELLSHTLDILNDWNEKHKNQ